jgi:hypothetical protein
LTVAIASEVDGLEVKCDGVVVAKATWRTAVPFDPGTHVVIASAPGRKPWEAKVDLSPSGAQTVTVPELEPEQATDRMAPTPPTHAPAPVATPTPAPTQTLDTSATPPDATPVSPPKSTRALGFVVGGAGVVALGVGGYFGVQAISKRSDAKNACPSSTCTDPAGVAYNDDARRAATIADIGIGVGLVALGVGAYLVLRSPATPPRTSMLVAPTFDAHGGGVALHASW